MKNKLIFLCSGLVMLAVFSFGCSQKPQQNEDPTGMKFLTEANKNFEFRKFKEAIEIYQQSLKLLKYKNNREAANKYLSQSYIFLARNAFNNANYPEAAKYYRLAIEQPELDMPGTLKATLHSELGLVYTQQNQYPAAMTEFAAALKIDPNAKRVHFYVGNIYMTQRKYDLAIAEYKKEIALDPDFAEAYNNLGSAYVGINQLRQAIPHFGKAIDLKPNYFIAYQNLASAYSNAGDYGQALRVYERLLEKNPEMKEAYVYMAEIHMLVGDQRKAYEALKTALEKGYRNWKYLTEYSRGLRTAREYGWFKKLVEKYKNS